MTNNGIGTQNARDAAAARKSEWWRERAVAELNAKLDKAIEERRYFGRVCIEVIFQDSRIIGIDTELKHQIRE